MRRLRAGTDVPPLPGGPGTNRGIGDPSVRSSLDWDRLTPRPRKRGPGACVFGEGRGREAAMARREAPHLRKKV